MRLNKGIKEEITHSFFIIKGEISVHYFRRSIKAQQQKRDSSNSRDSKPEEEPIKQKWHLEINEFNDDIEITAQRDTIMVYFGKVDNIDAKDKYKQSMLFKSSFLVMGNARQVEANFDDIDRKSVRASFNNMRPTIR